MKAITVFTLSFCGLIAIANYAFNIIALFFSSFLVLGFTAFAFWFNLDQDVEINKDVKQLKPKLLEGNNRCRVCASTDIDTMWSSGKASLFTLKFCSITCHTIYFRYVYWSVGIGLIIAPLTPIVSIDRFTDLSFSAGIVVLFIAIIGFERDSRNRRFDITRQLLHDDHFPLTRTLDGSVIPKYHYSSEHSKGEVSKIFVENLDDHVKVCCYQTARLGENYCKCGKSISPELKSAVK